jgi:hypothetical protein
MSMRIIEGLLTSVLFGSGAATRRMRGLMGIGLGQVARTGRRMGSGRVGRDGGAQGWRHLLVSFDFAARARGARGCPRADSSRRFEGRASPAFELELRRKGDAFSVSCLSALQRAPSARDAVRLADGKRAIREGWACKPSPSNPTTQGAQAPCSLRQNKKGSRREPVLFWRRGWDSNPRYGHPYA